jgi:hypothetical protein
MKNSVKTPLVMVVLFVLGAAFSYFVFAAPIKSEAGNSSLQVEVVQDPADTVRNPYAPPVRQQYQEVSYSQLGYLSSGSEKRPLFGKRACHRDKWFYYTEVDGIKLPVEFKKRNCTASPGCDMVACRDAVQVDGRTYSVNLYESDMFTYNPFL